MLKASLFPLLIACLVLNISALSAQSTFENLNGSERWELAFSDPGTVNWQSNWFLDGQKATVENSQLGMHFKAGPAGGEDAHHAVLWTRASFEGDLKIEYRYTRTDNQTAYVNILYIQATGIGDGPYHRDIYQWKELRKVPQMSKYFRFMNTLHISYAAFTGPDSDYVRVRRYPVTDQIKFKDLEVPPSYYDTGLFKTGITYQITVIKTSSELFFTATGDGKTQEYRWDLSKVAPVEQGRIGLRHMYTRAATYRDFKVWVLK